jgi:hypothetical protein
MIIHDEAMEKGEEIQNKISELKKIAEELRKDTLHDAKEIEEIHKEIQELKRADSLMMDWMHHFTLPNEETMTHKEIMEYLKQEKSKIKEVKEITYQALGKAEKIKLKYHADDAAQKH